MSIRGLILASFRHYWKSHLGLLFGVFLTAAILSGSLLVGDSVRASLRLAASQRLGKIGSGMLGGDRWFTDTLAQASHGVPLIIVRGAVTASGGEARANGMQMLGVDGNFWHLSPSGKTIALDHDSVAVNEPLAAQLHLAIGSEVLLRLEKPSAISRDAPLSGEANQDITLRRKVGAILPAEDFGSFQLVAAPVAGATIFVPLADLQAALNQKGHVNSMLTADTSPPEALPLKPQLGDFALQLVRVPGPHPEWEIRSDRIFLDETVAKKLLAQPGAHGILTYLVNALTANKTSASYSFVTADATLGLDAPEPILPELIPADVTQWLADDLSLTPGAQFIMRYFTVGLGRNLKEQTATFVVHQVIPMNDPMVNNSWTPEFPGVSEAKNCRDWQPGIPMKLDTIRDKDEAYWKQYRATPKAFIPLAAGQALWGNRFGNLTSIRFPDTGQDVNKLSEQLVNNLALADIGLTARDFKAEASAAAEGSVDFGGLFIGLSLFIIAASLVFSVLLFLFSIEKRISQFGLFFALGLSKKSARILLLGETGLVALLGAALGLLGGVLYTKAALYGLNSIWSGATVGLKLIYGGQPSSLATAFASSLLVSLGTLAWASRKIFRQPPILLLAGEAWSAPAATPSTSPAPSSRLRSILSATGRAWAKCRPWLPWVLIVLAVALSAAGAQSSDPEEIAGMFFGSGFCLLGCGLLLASRKLKQMAASQIQAASLGAVGLRNITRRPGRSLAVMGMMAGGIFLVIAVNAFRLGSSPDDSHRDGGTGGFALIGESTLPVYEDLNTESAWDAFALDDKLMRQVHVVPFRVREGDDASCLNLNKAQNPVLYGVNPQWLAEQKAFAFAEGDWSLLQSPPAASGAVPEIPGIADQATAQWGLGKGIGDFVDYTDGQGKTFHVKLVGLLAGSVLQGKVIISERDFLAKYPDAAGYKFFLVDVSAGKTAANQNPVETVRAHLTRQLEARGLALESTASRLAAFERVQNTYIGIFTVLGGLGVLLGTAGLGVLAARNILERRGEFGLMLALGFKPRALRRMVLSEHLALLIGGLILGLICAAIAVWPDVRQSGGALPWSFLAWLNLGILAFGAFVCWLAAANALRGDLMDALRRE